jgi:hypothetical protein
MSFGGGWSYQDPTQVPSSNGLQAQNVSFIKGRSGMQVGTRLGYSVAFATTDEISAMSNWISDLGNLLLWYRASDQSVWAIDITNQPLPQVELIAGSLIGIAATFSQAGARLFLSFFTVSGQGASGARILTYQSGFVNDLAFLPPITYVPPPPSEPGPGNSTPGLHLFGYLIEYRSGFITRPSPDSGVGTNPNINTFTPIAYTVGGGTYLSWSLTTTWPVGAIAVHPMMTAFGNPAQWFIPQGLSQAVVGGASSTITFIINISDQQLLATGQDVTYSLTLLTNSVSNVPQFYPSVVLTHGNRMVYVCQIPNNVGGLSSALFVSAIGAYQQIDPALSLIQLPGLRDITTCISMDGVLYMFGPEWTYQTTDNQGDPSTWATPQLIDGSRGTLAIRGVQVAPSGTYAWVAAQDGMYYFQGTFPALPISYNQDHIWNRINWNAAQAIQIVDVPHKRTVTVLACLDGATTPNAELVWDYTLGFTPSAANFSGPDFLQGFNMGAIASVKNSLPGAVTAASQQQELWLGSSLHDGILRNNQSTDVNPYLDNGFPIFSTYETSLFPNMGGKSAKGVIYHHHGADYRLTGNGVAQIQAFSLDHAQVFNVLPVTLSQSPGLMPHRSFDNISEGMSHLITQGMNLVHDPSFEGNT